MEDRWFPICADLGNFGSVISSFLNSHQRPDCVTACLCRHGELTYKLLRTNKCRVGSSQGQNGGRRDITPETYRYAVLHLF